VAWEDDRLGSQLAIYSNHLTSAGALAWPGGVSLAWDAVSLMQRPVLLSAGGGFFMVHHQTTSELYAARYDASGTRWSAGSVRLGSNAPAADDVEVQVVPDGLGGLFAAWNAETPAAEYYAQRMDAGGVIQWGPTGVLIIMDAAWAAAWQLFGDRLAIAPDGHGGMIAAFSGYFVGLDPSLNVRAQRMSANGSRLWGDKGVLVGGAANHQRLPHLAASENEGFIAVWFDARNNAIESYAQRFDVWGHLGDASPAISAVHDVPNDQGGSMLVEWTKSHLDALPDRTVWQYSLWRRVPAGAAAGARVIGALEARPPDAPRVVRVTMAGGETVYWEYVGTKPASTQPGYSAVVPTTSDSLPGANPYTLVMVQAEGISGNPFWPSAPDSGYSVDDLAPPTPAPFTGVFEAGETQLSWGASAAADFAFYRLYRGVTPDFALSGGSQIAQTTVQAFAASPGNYYYKLVAVDLHGNASPPALVSPPGPVDVEADEVPAKFAFALVRPNPARGPVDLSIALPLDGRVRLAIYDVGGRLVRLISDVNLPAGRHAYRWDLRGDDGAAVASGLYRARVEASGFVATRRFVAIR
jgi:hypothetical protein